MSIKAPDSAAAAVTTVNPNCFDSSKWLEYFQENKRTRPVFDLSQEIDLNEKLRGPLIRSLQRFQIGETGDGKHLRKYANCIGDPGYLQCVDLFIREEQVHGQILAEVILCAGGTLLSWHWTDVAFILLRRLLGLKTEILILLIAEVIGKCFYKCIADKIENACLSEVFAVIVFDEIAHLQFHAEFLSYRFERHSWWVKYFAHYIWCMIFHSACFVFIADHRLALEALGIAPADFIARCSREFQRCAVTAFSRVHE